MSLESTGKSAVVLSSHELDAMRRRAFTGKLIIGGDPREAEAAAKKKADRKLASTQRASKWGDTLIAQRKAKEDARIKREQEAEAARCALDREEEEIRAKERLEVLRRANKLMTAQTDRMKLIKSQRMNSDVLDVRARQIALKKKKKELEAESEAEYARLLEEQMADHDRKEAEALAARQAKIKEIARMQQEQKDKFVESYIAELKAEKAEGEDIRRKAEAAYEADQAAAAKKLAEAKLRNMEMRKANERMQAIRRAEAKKAEEEERRHEMYAADKEREMRRREDFVEYKRAEADKRASNMRSTMERDFMSRMADEGARVDAQVAEADAKKEAEFQAQQERRRQMQEAINKSRKAQLARKAAAKKAEEDEKKRFSLEWSKIQSDLEREEREEKESRRRKALEVQSFVLRQAREKEATIEAQMEEDLRADREAVSRSDAGDKEFQAMAEKLIDEEIARGHNPVHAARSVHRTKGERLIPANAMF